MLLTKLKGLNRLLFWRTPIPERFLMKTDWDFSLSVPALPRPAISELQEKWPWVRRIAYDVSPVTPVRFRLATVLWPGESNVDGPEYRRRIGFSESGKLLGYQQLLWLFENQERFPVLLSFFGDVSIDAPGLVVVGEDGEENSPYFHKRNGRWYVGWGQIFKVSFDRRCRVAIDE